MSESENSSTNVNKTESNREIAELNRQIAGQARLFDSILSSISDFAYTFDKEGRFLFINQALLDLWGLKLEQAVGKNFFELKYPAALAARLQHQIQQVFETRQRVTDETPYTSPTGVAGYYEYIFSPSFDADGSVQVVVGTTRNITARKEAEEEIKQLSQLNRDILESITDAFFALDRNWRFTYVNKQAEQMLDRQPGDMLGKIIWEVYPGLKGSEFQKAYYRAADEKITSTLTAFYPDHDRYYEVHVYPAPKGITIYFRDVTGQIRIDQALAESEEKYRSLFSSIDEAVCLVEVLFDETGEPVDYFFLEVNSAFEKQTGLRDAAGKRILELVPALETRWFEIYGKIALTGEPARFMEGSEALSRWFDVYAFRLGEEPSRTVAIIFKDISDSRQAEREREQLLKQVEAERSKLDYLFTHAPAFVATLRGPEHVFELTNPAYMQLIGYRDVIGKPVRAALPEIEGQGFFELLDNVYRTGEPFAGKALPADIQRQPDSAPEKRFIDLVYQPVFEADGSVSGIFVHGVDITEQVQARREAELANRLKDDFLAMLSHELRTPLNAILGWSQMLQNRNLSESASKKAIVTIERSAQAQNQLINDLLDVSRIITGKLRLEIRAVDLPAVIGAAVDAVRPAADAKNIRLQLMLDSDAGPISGDADRLQQVVWNLLSNAVKFTPKEGQITVSLERVDSYVEIIVSDTGKGIEAEFLPHVFDRFRQADQASSRKYGGLGLGLAIVRQLVELHGGQVSAESRGIGHGATFIVRLPLLAFRFAAETDELNGQDQLEQMLNDLPAINGLRLMVVDDEADAREMLQSILAEYGAIVTIAASVNEALKQLEQNSFDLIVSDIGMPEEDGYSLIAKVRQLPGKPGKIPAIALTAFARVEDRLRVLSAGFQMHVPKPVEVAELITVIANLTQGNKG